MTSDPIADMLTRVRNAIRARHQKLDVPASKLKTEIARLLKEEGYISNYKTQEEEGKLVLRVYLKYGGTEAAIRDLARISRPGCRVYIDHAEGRDDGASGAPRGCRRRVALRSLVAAVISAQWSDRNCSLSAFNCSLFLRAAVERTSEMLLRDSQAKKD